MARSPVNRPRGFSLIEVMIAVVVLSFGLLALSALQAGLFRAGAEAKARANATALAQNAVENARSFAYITMPAASGYTGPTYMSLGTASLGTQTVGGVTYTVSQTVTRLCWGGASFSEAACVNPVAYSGSRPEFKNVEVAVTWTADDGTTKRIEVEDSVPAVAPADSLQIVRTPTANASGPQVWIVPPNKDNPQVVPIAVGDDKSAASTNPKPEQFVEDLSAATRFSVQLFTGSSSGEEVRLNRKLDVAAVSCLCSRNGTEVSTASNPTYLPAIWNGKLQAYVEPQPAPAGTKIATAVTTNSDISPMCTICCRDHRESTARSNPRQDPYRALLTSEAAEEHWGYKKKGANNYLIGEPMVQWGTGSTATSGEYLEACQLVRVNGRMRVAVDAQMVDMQVTPLSDNFSTYRDSGFITNYAAYVKQLVQDGMAALPTGYAGPEARFPGAASTLQSSYSGVTDPALIDLTSATAGTRRKLVAFGLYLDYLSADTRAAYACALTKNDTGDCAGLGKLDPLEVLPFYAVNVANLGTWTSERPGALSVADAQYKQGLLTDDGGIVTVQTGTHGTASTAATSNILVMLQMGRSNSALAGTLPIDPDDGASANIFNDVQKFLRTGSSNSTTQRNSLFVKLSSTSTLSIKSLTVTSPAGVTICQAVSNADPTKNCRFDAPAAGLTVAITGYTTSSKSKGTTIITNRKVCWPATVSGTVTGDGTTSDATTLTLPSMDAGNPYTLTIDIVDEGQSCPGTAALTRA